MTIGEGGGPPKPPPFGMPALATFVQSDAYEVVNHSADVIWEHLRARACVTQEQTVRSFGDFGGAARI